MLYNIIRKRFMKTTFSGNNMADVKKANLCQ